MAVKDIRSNLQEIVAFNQIISSITTTNGVVIDTADFELGLMFSLAATLLTGGDFTLQLQQASNLAFDEDVSLITGDQLIGTLPVIDAASVEGDVLETVGVISNLRFVRANIVSTTTDTSTIVVIATQKAENMPVV